MQLRLDCLPPSIDINGLNKTDRVRIKQIGFQKWLVEVSMAQEKRMKKVGHRYMFTGGKLAQ